MIFKILDRLREKPEPVRRQVAVLLTLVLMSGVVFLWMATLPGRFENTTQEAEKNISPFSVLMEQGKVFYDSATDGVSAARDVIQSDVLPAAALLSSGSTTTPIFEEEVISPDLSGDSPF